MIPNLFYAQKIPENIPRKMQEIVDKINKCRTKEKALKKAYDNLAKTHSSSKYGVWKHFPTLFIHDISKLWKERKLTCTSISFLLRVLLVKSRHFNEKTAKIQSRLVLICPHVFLKVKTEKGWRTIDIWGKSHGIPYGRRARLSDWFSKKKIKKE